MSLIIRSLNLYRQTHSSSYIFSKSDPAQKKEIARLMLDIFYKTDPSSMYTKVSEIPKISMAIQEMSLESLDEDLSFVATEYKKKQVCGVAINGIRPAVVNQNYMETVLSKVQSKRERTLLELWRFISTMPSDAEKYFEGVKDVFEIRYLVVDPSHRNRGIATALVNHSKKEAAAQGHEFIRIDCTSHFTARIASAAGMECIYEINYEDYKNPSGEHVFHNVIFPHTKVMVYVGKSKPR